MAHNEVISTHAEHSGHRSSARDLSQSAGPQRLLGLSSKLAQSLVWFVGRLSLTRWFDLQVEGLENLPTDQPAILAANHSSHLDGPAVIAAVNRGMNQVYSLAAKDYFFDSSWKGKICQHVLNMVPFQRRGGRSLDSLKACQSLIEQGKMILLFPEGTRSKTGKLQSFKLGTGFMAMQLNVSVVPVHIEGSFQALPKGVSLPRRHPIRVRFAEPIPIEAYQERATEQNNRQLCREIVKEIRISIKALSQPEISDTLSSGRGVSPRPHPMSMSPRK